MPPSSVLYLEADRTVTLRDAAQLSHRHVELEEPAMAVSRVLLERDARGWVRHGNYRDCENRSFTPDDPACAMLYKPQNDWLQYNKKKTAVRFKCELIDKQALATDDSAAGDVAPQSKVSTIKNAARPDSDRRVMR